MHGKLTAITALGALALSGAPAAHASQAAVSATLSGGPIQRAGVEPTALRPLGTPSARAAQAGRRVGGLYLGGATGRFVQFISLRLNGRATRATERATVVARCRGEAAISSLLDNLTIRPIAVTDGRAKGSAVIDEEVPESVPAVGGLSRRGLVIYRIRVGINGRAAGVLRSRFTLSDPDTGETRSRCSTGAIRWSARIAPRSAGRGNSAPVGRSGYFGRTAQRLPFLLRVLPGGRAVRPAGMTFNASCPSLRGSPLDVVAPERMRISPPKRRAGRPVAGTGGRFGSSGRLTRRFSSDQYGPVSETYRWRLRGRFGSDGVAGTWRVDGVVVREADGTEVDRCTTGRNRWHAVR